MNIKESIGKLNVDLKNIGSNYQLKCNFRYDALKKDEAWKYFSTTDGLKTWFPELSIDLSKKVINFDMEDFHETIKILSTEEYSLEILWDPPTTVEISLDDVRVYFKEVIPKNYSNEFAQAIDDMSGWVTHMLRLSEFFSGKKLSDVTDVDMEEIKGYLKNLMVDN